MCNLFIGAIFGFLFSLLTWFITYFIQERKKVNEKKLQTLERKSTKERIHHGFNTRIWEESQLHGNITDLISEEQEKIRSIYQELTILNTAVSVYYLNSREQEDQAVFDEAIIENAKRTKPILLEKLKEAKGIISRAIKRK